MSCSFASSQNCQLHGFGEAPFITPMQYCIAACNGCHGLFCMFPVMDIISSQCANRSCDLLGVVMPGDATRSYTVCLQVHCFSTHAPTLHNTYKHMGAIQGAASNATHLCMCTVP